MNVLCLIFFIYCIFFFSKQKHAYIIKEDKKEKKKELVQEFMITLFSLNSLYYKLIII